MCADFEMGPPQRAPVCTKGGQMKEDYHALLTNVSPGPNNHIII